MHELLRPVLVLAVIAGMVPSASACLNDRELKTYEREFKSRYMDKSSEPVSPGELRIPLADEGHRFTVALVGVMLLAGACVLGVTRPRSDA